MNKSIHRYATGYFLLLLLPLLAGCSKEEEGPVPVSLIARSQEMEAEGRAATIIDENAGFSPTLFSTTIQGDYTHTDPYSWTRNVIVAASSGSITFPSPSPGVAPGEGFSETGIPYYPLTGQWMYLVGVHPQAEAVDGSVTYSINGKQDIMYAKEIKGTKWEVDHFAPLTFSHLLTQLQLKAVKTENQGLPVVVTSILLKEVSQTVVFPLSTGVPEFSDTGDFLIPDADISDESISGTGQKVNLVTVLLPPRDQSSYSMDVTTTIGTFKDVSMKLEGEGAGKGFQAGYAYEITLNVTDRSLSVENVTVTPWTTTDANGEMNIH